MVTTEIKVLEPYEDDRGNRIEVPDGHSGVRFHLWLRGTNNRLIIEPGARVKRLTGAFDGDDGVMRIGPQSGTRSGAWHFRVGEKSSIHIGKDVSCTQFCILSAVEGTNLTIGDDCMIAEGCAIRADDAHAIYDVRTGQRVNISADVTLGDHVWLGYGATVLSGVAVGSGSVIATQSVVTRSAPNNCVVAGNPARIVRRDIAWERPHLSMTAPAFRPDATAIEKSQYWHLTDDSGP